MQRSITTDNQVPSKNGGQSPLYFSWEIFMSSKNNAGSNPKQKRSSRMRCGILLTTLGLGFFAGCTTTMHNPAKQLVNHIGTKASEARMRDKVEKDPFPTAKQVGLD
jgi:hypothetical protein